MVLVSKDDGNTWVEIHAGLGGQTVWDLVHIPTHNTILAAVNDRGLMRINLDAVTAALP
jgi:hypothetical protein